MKVLIAHEAREAHSGCYHLPNDANTGSLCGTINEESEFASDSSQVLTREAAQRRGLHVCGNCAAIADRSLATRSREATD